MDIEQAFLEGRYQEIAAVSVMPEKLRDKMFYAIALFKTGEIIEAENILKGLSFELDILAKGLFYLAKISRIKGDSDSAKYYIERYLAFYPDDDEALDVLEGENAAGGFIEEISQGLARLYSSQGFFEQALDIYLELLKKDDSKIMMNEALGVQDKFIIKTLETWLERLKYENTGD